MDNVELEGLIVQNFAEKMNNLLNFIVELFKKCKNNGKELINETLLQIGLNMIRSKNTVHTMEKFALNSYQYWNEIKSRDDSFFLKNMDSIFADPDNSSNLNIFKKLLFARNKLGDRIVTDADRNQIWDYIHIFIGLVIEYIHYHRQPLQIVTYGRRSVLMEGVYQNESYLAGLELDDFAVRSMYNVQLIFPLPKMK